MASKAAVAAVVSFVFFVLGRALILVSPLAGLHPHLLDTWARKRHKLQLVKAQLG
jgi:hypothetical protein